MIFSKEKQEILDVVNSMPIPNFEKKVYAKGVMYNEMQTKHSIGKRVGKSIAFISAVLACCGMFYYNTSAEELEDYEDRVSVMGHSISVDDYAFNTKTVTYNKTVTVNLKVDGSAKKVIPVTYDDWVEEADNCKSEWYLSEIHLEYSDEVLHMPYKHQRYVWVLCKMKGIDYWDIMAIIARESRFDAEANTGSYKGYMQIGSDPAYDMKKRLNDFTLDRNNIYDNLKLGIELYLDCLERTNYDKYSANWAYATGYWGYLSQKKNGRTSNSDADKALKFYKLLTDTTLNPRG